MGGFWLDGPLHLEILVVEGPVVELEGGSNCFPVSCGNIEYHRYLKINVDCIDVLQIIPSSYVLKVVHDGWIYLAKGD